MVKQQKNSGVKMKRQGDMETMGGSPSEMFNRMIMDPARNTIQTLPTMRMENRMRMNNHINDYMMRKEKMMRNEDDSGRSPIGYQETLG